MVFFFHLPMCYYSVNPAYEAMPCVLEEVGCDPSVVIVDFETS